MPDPNVNQRRKARDFQTNPLRKEEVTAYLQSAMDKLMQARDAGSDALLHFEEAVVVYSTLAVLMKENLERATAEPAASEQPNQTRPSY